MSGSLLEKTPFYDKMILANDERIVSFQSDIAMRGAPDAVFLPEKIGDLKEVLQYCHREKLPITFCGNQTSMTGSSVAENGVLISTSKLNKLLDIDKKTGTATAQPGMLLSDFQESLWQNGFFYPPDPTSRQEASLGATVATNATGEDSLQYGSTRCHIHSLKILLATGEEIILAREPEDRPDKGKNRAGYYLKGSPIDLFIGSEGTLGIFTEITVDLIRNPSNHFAAMAFFPSLASALHSVTKIMSSQYPLEPRCLELMDEECLNILRLRQDCFFIPFNAKAALYFKQEYRSETERETQLNQWLEKLTEFLKNDSAHHLLDATIVATDQNKKVFFRKLRHSIPATMIERANQYTREEGGKIGTDWWVPINNLEKAILTAVKENEDCQLSYCVFGHIGNGHPHFEYIAKNAEEKDKIRQLVLNQCKRAVSWGGGVAGEHGIGKIKKNLLHIQYSPHVIDQMISRKKFFDPHWILGRNTLFSCPQQ